MKLKAEFENYKLLKNKVVEFNDYGVWLVQGGNEKGKSSMVEGLLSLFRAENKTSEPVTKGLDEGKINGFITLPDGQEYIIKFDFTNEKNQFTLIYPDGKRTKKVTEIREVFQYNSFTAEEFLKWSDTAEGKKKQKAIILSLLSQKAQEDYYKAELAETKLYKERADENSTYTSLKAICDKIEPLSEEKQSHIDRLSEIKEGLATLREKYDCVSSDTYFNKKIDGIIESVQAVRKEIESLFKNSYDDTILNNLRTSLHDRKKIVEDVIALKARIEKGESVIEELTILKAKTEKDVENKKLLQQSALNVTELENKLKKAREAKNKVITDAKLPISDISIEEDGIYIVTPAGQVPFNSTQVSTSRVMKLVAKIILLTNPKVPILFLSRGESFDENSLNELSLFAEENNAMVVLDRVLTEAKDLEVVGYENK